MKKFICLAFMATAFLCVEHGNAGAAVPCQLELTLDQGEISPALAKMILTAASNQVDADYQSLYDSYLSGSVTISITSEGYLVSDGGSMNVILAEDGI